MKTIRLTQEISDIVVTVTQNDRENNSYMLLADGELHHTVTFRFIKSNVTVAIRAIIVAFQNVHGTLKTIQHHMVPSVTSDLLVRSVIGGHATILVEGIIRIDKNAPKSDAYQRVDSLVLTNDARISVSPTLEIQSSDVRCTHGATIGAVPEEQIWYLKNRGVSQRDATYLIAEGFIKSCIDDTLDTKDQEEIMKPYQHLLRKEIV